MHIREILLPAHVVLGKINGGEGGSSKFGGSGAGNPAGYASSGSSYSAINGTGGLLIIFGNSIVNNSTISSIGSNGGNDSEGGGGSGGGSINFFYKDDFIKGTISCIGGTGGCDSYRSAGAGGNGSISSGCIATGTYVAD